MYLKWLSSENVLELVAKVAHCEYIKNHWIIYVKKGKMVNFMLCNFISILEMAQKCSG